MEFIVTRTSIHNNERPCWEATPKTITVNIYGVEKQMNVWVVNFSNLKELAKFEKKYGQFIIGRYIWDDSLISIEIYDRYRE